MSRSLEAVVVTRDVVVVSGSAVVVIACVDGDPHAAKKSASAPARTTGLIRNPF
jgi:hypothetical protein